MAPSEEPQTPREEIVAELAARLAAIWLGHPVRVAIGGVEASGKTTLADELAAVVRSRGREVVRASVDGFHQPRAECYGRGPDGPEGYYHVTTDYAAVIREVLDPLGPGGSFRYRTAVFDFRTDDKVDLPQQVAAADAVLLFDGVFLLRERIPQNVSLFPAVP